MNTIRSSLSQLRSLLKNTGTALCTPIQSYDIVPPLRHMTTTAQSPSALSCATVSQLNRPKHTVQLPHKTSISIRNYSIVGQGPLAQSQASAGVTSLGVLDDAPVEIIDMRTPERIAATKKWQREGARSQSLIITCEHASNRLPAPYSWAKEDEWIKDTHWASDPGAAEFVRELVVDTKSTAVLSRYSRLLIDPNRPMSSETLFRDTADSLPIQLNANISAEEKARRITSLYLPYHLELGRCASQVDPLLILSIHTFTRNYEGEERHFELGVLSSTDDAVASQWAEAFQHAGISTRVNAPWSGKEGFMFACDSLKISGAPGRRRGLMLEMRSDKALDPAWRASLRACLLPLLQEAGISVTL